MNTLNFGPIDKFILFGCCSLLLSVAKRIIRDGYQLTVFSAKRHLNEEIKDGKCLSELLYTNHIPFYESLDINKDLRILENISDKTMAISIGAAWIFDEDFINLFDGKLINMHGTRLPQHRGGATVSWQILRQDRLGFCLMHQVDKGIDTGNIIKYEEFVYPCSCRIPKDYQEYYYNQNMKFFGEFLTEIKNKNDFVCIGQPEYLSSYYPRLNTYKQAFIDWSWSLEHIECFINAFDDPYCGASTFIEGERVFLKDCYVSYVDGRFHPFQAGIVYRIGEGILFVAANEGTLIVKAVLSEDGQSIINNIKVGGRLFTPFEYLEKAKSFRAIYTPCGLKEK